MNPGAHVLFDIFGKNLAKCENLKELVVLNIFDDRPVFEEYFTAIHW